jgi:hypothetical protein
MRMKRAVIAVMAIACTPAVAFADRKDKTTDEGGGTGEDATSQIVLLNAASKLGDVARIDRVRRALESRGMLRKLPERLEAALDGRNIALSDLDAVKDAFAQFDSVTALALIDKDEQRILQNVGSGDPIPALAQLSEWRGMIAAQLEHDAEAVHWFRVARRFNPAWTPDKRLASPHVRELARRARAEAATMGRLRVVADADDATLMIDGHDPRGLSEKVEVTTGIHLVVVTAPHRAPHAELVEIRPNATTRLDLSLDEETRNDRAARIVDQTVASPPGPERLESARRLSKLVTGVKQVLVVEDGTEDHIMVRVYDLDGNRVSKLVDLQGTESSAVIARIVKGALEPDNMADVQTIARRTKPWYERWYVWAAVGTVALGGVAGFEYMSAGKSSIRGIQ